MFLGLLATPIRSQVVHACIHTLLATAQALGHSQFSHLFGYKATPRWDVRTCRNGCGSGLGMLLLGPHPGDLDTPWIGAAVWGCVASPPNLCFAGGVALVMLPTLSAPMCSFGVCIFRLRG